MKKKYFIFIPTLLQALVFLSFDLGVDEAHYMLYARHLALSYFDHPPLIGWVHFALNFIFGETLLSARLPALLIGVVSAQQTYRFLQRQKFAEGAALLGSLATGFSFQFFVLHVFLLPDTLCLLLIWPLMATTMKLCEKNSNRHWLQAGLWLGLLGLAKYTSVLLLIPMAVVLLKKHKFSFFKKPGFYGGIVIALSLISPIFIWNSLHQWRSFEYQSHHVLSSQEASWQSFLQSWALQLLIYSPFLWPWSMYGFVKLYQRMRQENTAELQFAWWTAAVTFVFFLYASLQNTVLPHWPVLFYIFTLSFGVATAFSRFPRSARLSVIATSMPLLLLSLFLAFGGAYRFPQAFKDVVGWPQLMEQAQEKVNPQQYLAVTNWTYASRALFYGKEIESRIFILGSTNDQFEIWRQGNPEGHDVLVLQMKDDIKNLDKLIQCQRWEPAEEKEIFARGRHVLDVQFRWCRKAHLL